MHKPGVLLRIDTSGEGMIFGALSDKLFSEGLFYIVYHQKAKY